MLVVHVFFFFKVDRNESVHSVSPLLFNNVISTNAKNKTNKQKPSDRKIMYVVVCNCDGDD